MKYNVKKPGLARRGLLLKVLSSLYFDGRCTSTILCSRSRCGAREAMTVGCKPTTLYLKLRLTTYSHRFTEAASASSSSARRAAPAPRAKRKIQKIVNRDAHCPSMSSCLANAMKYNVKSQDSGDTRKHERLVNLPNQVLNALTYASLLDAVWPTCLSYCRKAAAPRAKLLPHRAAASMIIKWTATPSKRNPPAPALYECTPPRRAHPPTILNSLRMIRV